MKNVFIKLSVIIDVIIMIVSFAYIEVYVWIPFIICLIAMGYLAAFLYANDFIVKE